MGEREKRSNGDNLSQEGREDVRCPRSTDGSELRKTIGT